MRVDSASILTSRLGKHLYKYRGSLRAHHRAREVEPDSPCMLSAQGKTEELGAFWIFPPFMATEPLDLEGTVLYYSPDGDLPGACYW